MGKKEPTNLTGISFVATMGLSKVNNVEPFKFQENHNFSRFYGLTIDELERLLEKFEISSDISRVIDHYNGYRNNTLSVWSIMKYLNNEGIIKNYWRASGIAVNLYGALKITTVSSIITKLLSGMYNEYEINYIEKITIADISRLKRVIEKPSPELDNVDTFFSFLLEQGYFSIVDINYSERKIKIKIPNCEIKTEFSDTLLKFYSETYNINMETVKECASLFDEITESDDDNNKLKMKEICNLLNVIIRPCNICSKNEATLHHIIFIIIFHCKTFKCYSEIRSDKETRKRLDLLMLKDNLGLILELKNDKNPEEGLLQIKEKNYCAAFENDYYNPGPDKIDVKY